MTVHSKKSRKSKLSRSRNRRSEQASETVLTFSKLEDRQLLAAVAVSNTTDFVNANVSSIASLIANDGGDGISLREAISASNNTVGLDTISFDGSVFTGGAASLIRLTQGELEVSDSLTIDGSSATQLVITGDAAGNDVTVGGTITDVAASLAANSDALNDNSRVINFSTPTGDLTLFNLTVTGGRTSSNGGAIFSDSGNVTLTESTVSGNDASASGGGIHTRIGSVTLNESTVSGNSSRIFGGGVFGRDVTLTNSTVSGNRTDEVSGGIHSRYGAVSLTNSTVTDNFAFETGGGIGRAASLTLRNSIVAGNNAGTTAPDFQAPSNVANNLIVEHSLIGNTTGTGVTSETGTGNILNQPARLGPLADNGGVTLTHALLPGSEAIDAGSDVLAVDAAGALLINDQRGFPFARSVDDSSRTGSAVDIGAFERQVPAGFPLVVDNPVDESDGDFSQGDLSLREAIELANDGAGADTITFDGSVFTGGTASVLRLTQGELVVSDSLTLDGSTGTDIVISGDSAGNDVTVNGVITDVAASLAANGSLLDDNTRVLRNRGDLILANLTVTGGHASGGGGIYSNNILSLIDSTVSGNHASGFLAYGGGIQNFRGTVTLNSSVVSNNSTAGDFARGGGIAGLRYGSVSIINSTVSGNSTADDGANGGGIYTANGDISITNSTVSGNSTADAVGGGIYSRTGSISLTNSTVSGNNSTGNGAAGGIGFSRGAVLIANSTVTANSASNAGGGVFSFNTSEGSLAIRNSIVTGNSDNGTAPNVVGSVNELIVENSLIGNTTGSGITATTGAGNILNQQALLGPLANNGGPTLTHALLPGSPAIDAGNNALAVDPEGVILPADQRGEIRIQFGAVDIGAFELQPISAPTVSGVVRDGGGVLARPDLLSTFVVNFDQDVNISAEDLIIQNDTLGGLPINTSGIGFSYDALSRTATWDFNGLPAAFYTFELSDTITGVVGGFALDGDGDGDAGGDFSAPVYVAIPGDANLDGRVDVLGDAFILVGSLGTTSGAAYADGDFNADGQVNVLGDAFILVANLGRDVRVPLPSSIASRQDRSDSVLVVVDNRFDDIEASSSLLQTGEEQEFAKITTSASSSGQVTGLSLAGSLELRDEVFGNDFLI